MISANNKPVLVVEDSNDDFRILQRLMQRMAVENPIYRCTNGDEALEFLLQKGNFHNPEVAPRPYVILLDLNLPGIDGRDVLTKVKQDINLQEIPIIVFTTSSNPKDVELCYQKGANGYLVKPIDAQELRKLLQAFVDYWLKTNISPV